MYMRMCVYVYVYVHVYAYANKFTYANVSEHVFLWNTRAPRWIYFLDASRGLSRYPDRPAAHRKSPMRS